MMHVVTWLGLFILSSLFFWGNPLYTLDDMHVGSYSYKGDDALRGCFGKVLVTEYGGKTGGDSKQDILWGSDQVWDTLA